MDWYIPRCFQFPGYETRDVKEFFKTKVIEIHLTRREDKCFHCHRCGHELKGRLKEYPMKIRSLPVMELACFLFLRRLCGWCPRCKKTRAERIDFLSVESPHLTQDFAWCLGKLCEISPVSNAAEFTDVDDMTAWRIDFKRMQLMLRYYKLPPVTHISVDEIYTRRKKKHERESRDDRFFTVISDLKTRRVIWVTESRRKEALDEFFLILGPEMCEKIKAVAMDQHDGYKASVQQFCPKAAVVWDRFHLMQSFNEVANEVRKDMFELAAKGSEGKRLLLGKYRYVFLKKGSRRSLGEKEHIEKVAAKNHYLLKLELIKERLYTFFDAHDVQEAHNIFDEIGTWIIELGLLPLRAWWERLQEQWKVLANYFEFRISSALSEGINNVIKTLKRAAYGYRNMAYFKLKIMQKCGYLNSKYIPNIDFLIGAL